MGGIKMEDEDKEITNKEVPNGSEVIGTGNDARLALFDSIADESDRIIEEEANDDFSDKASSTTSEDDNDSDDDADDLSLSEDSLNNEDEDDQNEDESDLSITKEVKKFKLKINGVDSELTEEEVLARAQKVSAADEYLKQASEHKRQAEEELRLAREKISQPSHEDAAKESREERLALVRALQMGTEEEALEALDKLRSPSTPSVNQDELARTVDERLSFQKAVEKFQTEYSDIFSDPILNKLAVDRDAELQRNGEQMDYWERFQKVGNEIREWKNGITKSVKPKTEIKDSLKEKQNKKASAPQVPSSANRKSSQAVEEDDDGEEDPREIIAAAAKARGGPQWMRG